MMWKAKFATTHCERLCPARIIVSPLGHWPATQVFPGRDPCNSSWTTCVPLCPQNLNNQRIIYNSLFIPGPEWSLFVRVRNIFSWCVQIIHHLKVHNDCWKNIHISPGFIYTGSEILIPDPKISGSPNHSKNLFIFVCSVSKLYLLICMWRVQLRSGSEWLIDFINWKLRIWISRKGQTIAHSLLITKVLRNTTPNYF